MIMITIKYQYFEKTLQSAELAENPSWTVAPFKN
jgi:hypothetical protein